MFFCFAPTTLGFLLLLRQEETQVHFQFNTPTFAVAVARNSPARDHCGYLPRGFKDFSQSQLLQKLFSSSLSLSLLKNQTQHERQNVQAEFKKLREILDSEERKELQKLKAEETAILCTMANSENELVQQSQLVRNLISDIEHRLQGSTMQMLQVRVGKKP